MDPKTQPVLQFAPGVQLALPTSLPEVSIKGVRPQLRYDTSLVALYPVAPVLGIIDAYALICRYLTRVRRLLYPERDPEPFPDPVGDSSDSALVALREMFNLPSDLSADPALISPADILARPRSFLGTGVRGPFPLIQAPPAKLIHTLAWVDANIKIAVERLGGVHRIPEDVLREVVHSALMIYAVLLKMDGHLLVRKISFNHSMYLQERIVDLAFGERLPSSFLPRIGFTANSMALSLLSSIGPIDFRELCELSVFMGIVWASESSRQAEFSSDRRAAVDVLLRDLERARRTFAVDHTEKLHEQVSMCERCSGVFVLDDNGESVFDLAIMQRLLAEFRGLTVSLIINRFPVSNNISLPTFRAALEEPAFVAARRFVAEQRLLIYTENQAFRSFEPDYLSELAREVIEESDFVYVKGANFFETFQLPKKTRYHCFTVSGPTGVMLTGFPEGTGIFARIPAGVNGFEYFDSTHITTLKELLSESCGEGG
jgi:hypothetical protein